MKKILVSTTIATLLMGQSALLQAQAHDHHNIISKLVGVTVGVPFGTAMGLLRGGVSKAIEYSHSTTDALGGGPIATVIGLPVGFGLGLTTGAVTGTVKGAVDGLTIGYDHPLSSDSLSISGEFTKYDPYTILQ